jgi:hypothetical protein
VSKATMGGQEFIEIVAPEMSAGVDVAVESWMTQVEQALYDPRLTTLGRMNSVKEVLNQYRSLKSKPLNQSRGLRRAV